MPAADFFKSLGLFIIEDFLAAAECAGLAESMVAAPSAKARVGIYGEVDEQTRRARDVRVPRADGARIKRRLMALQPELERHFGMPLSGCDVRFLKYGPGDFNRPHRDRSEREGSPQSERKVSAVLFLNAQTRRARRGSYSGGSLAFHGLLGAEPRWRGCAFPLEAGAGLLVAFRSDALHEVERVSAGLRLTVVAWFR